MRNYKPTSASHIDDRLYYRILGVIRDLPRMKEEADLLLYPSGKGADGQPHGGGTSDQVAEIASRRERVLADIAAVEQALALLPEEYQEAILRNIVEGVPYKSLGIYAHDNTLSKRRVEFITYVGQNLGLL